MKSKAWILCVLVCSLLFGGCASKKYVGPSSGRGAENQMLISRAVDQAFKKTDFTKFADKKIYLQVCGLAAKAAAQSPEESFISNHLLEKLSRAGARVVPRMEDADLHLTVALRIAGVDIVARDFYYTYHHTSIRGVVEAHMVGYDARTGKIVYTEDALGVILYRERYWFYIFGPYRKIWTLSKEEWKDEIGDYTVTEE
ncbi:MAG: hypothetical protein E3J72_15925 [Planctomycetota bacterium]|nr:MAG: hypothetical protein E3J72_15925 [Planctomycetota bacterium]